jgi:hypothetical protein
VCNFVCVIFYMYGAGLVNPYPEEFEWILLRF